jgi:hypothetical protein
MRRQLTRRAAMVTAAGLALSALPGCGGGGLLLRLPWKQIVSAVIRFAKTNGKWILVLIGVGDAGESVSQEVELDSDQIESVTVELKDGTKHTLKPTKEAK